MDVADPERRRDAEQPIFGEPGMALSQRWADSCIAALFDGDVAPDDIAAIWTDLQAQAGGAPRTLMSFAVVPETDWVRATQAQFEPIEITPRCGSCPRGAGHPIPLARSICARGPGHGVRHRHASDHTALPAVAAICARWQKRLLDYGCGSGILAMAARPRAALWSVGVDH